MAKPRKFNFLKILTEAPIEEDARCTILKNGQMMINKAANHKWGLDGKAVEFLYDDKKNALGIRLMQGNLREGDLGWNMKTMRLLVQKPEKGTIQFGVGRIMDYAGIAREDYKNLPMGEYSSLTETSKILYVEFSKAPSQDEDDGE